MTTQINYRAIIVNLLDKKIPYYVNDVKTNIRNSIFELRNKYPDDYDLIVNKFNNDYFNNNCSISRISSCILQYNNDKLLLDIYNILNFDDPSVNFTSQLNDLKHLFIEQLDDLKKQNFQLEEKVIALTSELNYVKECVNL